jgi:hypothetical protein
MHPFTCARQKVEEDVKSLGQRGIRALAVARTDANGASACLMHHLPPFSTHHLGLRCARLTACLTLCLPVCVAPDVSCPVFGTQASGAWRGC